MSNANVALIQSLYAAFGCGEIGTIVNAVTAQADWTITGNRAHFPTAGSWKGQSGVQDFFKSVGESMEFTAFTPKEFYACEDKVFVLGHYAAKVRKTGRSAASEWAHVFTIKDGKVTAFREFTDTATFAEAYRG